MNTIAEYVNDNIPDREMRLIDIDGTQLGIFGKFGALALARAKGLDLVVVAPDAKPMVAKFMDHSKSKYEAKKKQQEAKKKQTIIKIKEVQLSPVIQEHDIQVKERAARKFIEAGNKVKLTMLLRGRMIGKADIGLQVILNFIDRLKDIAVVDGKLKLDNNSFVIIILNFPSVLT